VIIYDNACKLHAYCLNREPGYFKNTQFFVDKLHWKNHTGCSPGYNLNLYSWGDSINSQAVEQGNSGLKKLKGSLSYMSAEHFVDHCKLYLFMKNEKKLAKIAK
jgi:hypothetical protein